MPFAPDESRNAPIEAAIPMQIVDVEADITIRILRFKEEKLCDYERRGDIVYFLRKKNYAVV